MYKNILWLVFLYLTTYSVSAISQERSTAKLQQYFLTFPPYWTTDPEEGFSGLHYRLAQTLYKHAGLNVEFTHVPYQKMAFEINKGNIPFINYGQTQGINTDDILHVCVPPTQITLKVYYVDDNLAKITTAEGFKHHKVIIMHGLPLGNYDAIKSDLSIMFMRPRTIQAALKGLQVGRGDYFIVFDNLIPHNAQQLFANKSLQLKSYPLFTMQGYPITTPKSYPGGKALCDKVKASYQQLVNDGVIDEHTKLLSQDSTNAIALFKK